jgi:hypothetical protein
MHRALYNGMVKTTKSENAFGMSVGGGVDYKLHRFFILLGWLGKIYCLILYTTVM